MESVADNWPLLAFGAFVASTVGLTVWFMHRSREYINKYYPEPPKEVPNDSDTGAEPDGDSGSSDSG
jgi:hypothetical protein